MNPASVNGHAPQTAHPTEESEARSRPSHGALEPTGSEPPRAPLGRATKGAPVTAAASSAEEVRAAVARARIAQYEWNLRPLVERVSALTSAARDMLRRRSEAIALAADEMGKVEIEGLFNEALGPLDTIKGWAKVVREATARRHVRLNPLSFPRKVAHVDLVARGVVGVIAAWNFPIAGLYRSTFPALLTGNAVVVKPSEYTPRTSAWFLERLAAALPADLVSVIQGDRRVGSALIDAGIDACVFTGSPESGRAVRLHCAERAIPSSIEMGGKDAAIVLADCDMPRTVAGITHWALSNAGQACGAIEVAYVDDRIADDFVARMAAAWRRLRAGGQRFAEVGPLAHQRQFDIVASHVEDAVAKGAVVVCGGAKDGDGLYYLPTLLDRCTDAMRVVTDETFGPVLAVVRVAGAAEAIRRTNASRYGLGASLWTRDIARATRLAERLDVGVVTINNHSFSGALPALPWGGTRETGFGVANGVHSLSTFVRPRVTVVDRARSPELFWMPYDDALWRLGDLLADVQLGRLGQVWRLPLVLRKRMTAAARFFK